ncbi:putative ABC transport system substrate-binding protein [Duganella sacchari]|uniref:Putative ABC transport system substrate-binding protein n=1 Tax=Duganella sacchari TaxID=551987 RepID=A0A1M7L8J6_9BURK|nr:ABC transporter substrate binding protein [Duganella sacchari]SHM73853.1 putative ABC transport system substrate-binding protein [Duganella sacchari]
MKKIINALFAAVVLLSSAGALQASGGALQSSAAVATAAADTGMLIEPMDIVTVAAPLRPDVRPVTLAQLEDQLRRPELQASLGKGSIAVVYPNVEEPFRSAFLAMIQGIEDRIKLRVRAYPVDPHVDTTDLNNTLKRSGTKVVIALGRQGLSATAGLDREISVLAGGVLLLSESENVTGISMTPDPAMLFSRLRLLLPELRRIIVVYNPQKSDWLIKLAREAAKAQNLELSAYVAADLASAAKLYSQLIASADNRHDAIWLPHDSTTVEESTILPLVLKESWNSNLPLFSSNVLHVKKGALFAMLPDNVELGRTLAASAMGVIAGDVRRRPLVPLRELQTAINLRTASHIGLNLGALQQRSFDFVYPQP